MFFIRKLLCLDDPGLDDPRLDDPRAPAWREREGHDSKIRLHTPFLDTFQLALHSARSCFMDI